jgi:hypothetical protein
MFLNSIDKLSFARFQVLMVTSTKIMAFWDTLSTLTRLHIAISLKAVIFKMIVVMDKFSL